MAHVEVAKRAGTVEKLVHILNRASASAAAATADMLDLLVWRRRRKRAAQLQGLAVGEGEMWRDGPARGSGIVESFLYGRIAVHQETRDLRETMGERESEKGRTDITSR